VRGKCMFKPEKAMQFMIQSQIYRRMQLEFAAAGIKFSQSQVHVSMDHQNRAQDASTLGVATAAATSDAVAAPLAEPAIAA
jgi:hypothetical protein